jgi:hypothetical protein
VAFAWRQGRQMCLGGNAGSWRTWSRDQKAGAKAPQLCHGCLGMLEPSEVTVLNGNQEACMKAAMARLGDAMLALILPAAEAGACCSLAGKKCKCAAPCGVTWCTQYYVNCYCQCSYASGRC